MKSLLIIFVISVFMYIGFYDAYKKSLERVTNENKELEKKVDSLLKQIKRSRK